MTEEEAKAWLTDTLHVSRETMERLDALRLLVLDEATRQNLISAATIPHFWVRHIVDSAQLLNPPRNGEVAAKSTEGSHVIMRGAFAGALPPSAATRLPPPRSGEDILRPDAAWLDLGTGAGFPGLVIAILRNAPIHLVESRRLRYDFLSRCAETLGLTHVTVHGCRVESLKLPPVDVISARAFAPLDKLLTLSLRFSHNGTVWLLPKGKSAKEEVESIRANWQGVFHVKQSLTDPDAAIIVASGVRRIKGRS